MQLKLNKRLGTSYEQIELRTISDDCICTKDQTYLAVMKISSINFELKSEAEQDAIIDSYRWFLNALPCPIQIIIRTRQLDLDDYVASLKNDADQENEALYRESIENYYDFVSSLVESKKILTKAFYVVVLPSVLPGKDDEATTKEQLRLSCDVVTKALSRLGMQSKRLNTLELIDFFYSFYSPEKAKIQPITAKTISMLANSNF
jgi:type IV secretory pathway VirB4 component